MYILDHRNADKFVAEQQRLGNDVEWDGWTLVFYKPSPNSVYTKQGVFRNGQWCYANRFDMDRTGKYQIDSRNLKRRVQR